MNAATLVSTLRGRGVELVPDGDELVVRPASRAADLLDDLRRLKPEVLAVLRHSRPPSLALDPATTREVLGRDADDPHAVACLRFDVLAVVRQLEQEIERGEITPGLRIIRGNPLALWLGMDQLARLLGAWDERTRRPRA
jgi:hypothetical protein